MEVRFDCDVEKVIEFMRREIPARRMPFVAAAVADIVRLAAGAMNDRAIRITEEPIR